MIDNTFWIWNNSESPDAFRKLKSKCVHYRFSDEKIRFCFFCNDFLKIGTGRTSLANQWLGLGAFAAKGPSSVPDWRCEIPWAARCGQKQNSLLGMYLLKCFIMRNIYEYRKYTNTYFLLHTHLPGSMTFSGNAKNDYYRDKLYREGTSETLT